MKACKLTRNSPKHFFSLYKEQKCVRFSISQANKEMKKSQRFSQFLFRLLKTNEKVRYYYNNNLDLIFRAERFNPDRANRVLF